MSREPFASPRLPQRLSLLIALSGFAMLTSSCANLGFSAREVARNQADPPQRQMPASVQAPCPLYVLPSRGPVANADLDSAYTIRGAQVVSCNAERQIAVAVHEGEHADEAEWRQARVKRNCVWWKFGRC